MLTFFDKGVDAALSILFIQVNGAALRCFARPASQSGPAIAYSIFLQVLNRKVPDENLLLLKPAQALADWSSEGSEIVLIYDVPLLFDN
jgi:hypothetical protein